MLKIIVVVFESRMSIVRRVNVNAFDTLTIERQERLEGVEVIALHNQVAGIFNAAAQRRIVLKDTIGRELGNFERVRFSVPIQSRQGKFLLKFND